ncbi:FAD dependent oxidoreductase [Rhodopirellula maiorica SM1]|uniref:FAD dependent oxidoreductase n=1 Tax=Rhodopirellula maiorica SM1 TaxID=1265738 RepID=M5RMZ8_9BACT|nr:TIGR03364 family FAD-dependent oxidoreductase [Rhodopirellula maiorica]EMI20680.1 FAD dependent oxidoreductase [Rhodopirellula maiorica SM1]
MTKHFDVAVIGAGIVGLAHAIAASRRGLSVALFERSHVAQAASVRNFGMIWPIGQPAGELYALALRSRELWIELQQQGVLELEQCGSIHVAKHHDELAVLEEFTELGTHQVEMLKPAEVLKRAAIVNGDGLLGGMYSPTELRVDPRTASARIAAWLQASGRAECHFGTTITHVKEGHLRSSAGDQWIADRIVVCSGSDLQTLYPECLSESGLKLCKLQMMKVQQDPIKTMSPHIAGGLTLRHYTSFTQCHSLAALQDRIATNHPELDRYGIHVMASPFRSGRLILGDSHEYGDAITPFDKREIDELMLRELRQLICLPNWTVCQRWHGVYAKHPTLPVFEAQPDEGVHVFVGTGGAGMTMSLGLADRSWQRWHDR